MQILEVVGEVMLLELANLRVKARCVCSIPRVNGIELELEVQLEVGVGIELACL